MFDRFVQSSFRAALASIAGLLLICGSASATPTWLGPTSLSATGESATGAQVAVDAQGDSVAVWQRVDAITVNTNDVQAAVRPAGGSWQAIPTTLASCFFFATTPRVAVDPRGDAIAVWECATQDPSSREIEAATAAGPALQWSRPVQLSNSADMNVEDPQVAIDASGDATVTWVTLGSGATSFVQAVQRPAGGTWSQPATVSRTDESVSAAPVAEDPSGDATAVWTINDGTNLVTEASTRVSGATAWSAPVDLSSADAAASNPQVAMSPQGAAIAVWQHGSSTNSTIQAAVHPAGGQWQQPLDISASGELAEKPQLAIGPQGDASAVWDRSNGTNTIVQAAQLPAGASAWQPAQNLSVTGENASAAQIAADSEGDVTAVWQRSNGTNTIVEAAVHPSGAAAWQKPVDLSATGQNAENPAVAVDPRGNATAVWDRSNGTNTIAQADGYDAGPLLREVSVPSRGVAGQPLTVSVSPLGVWSPVGNSVWEFGDGQLTTGSVLTHTYAAVGTYTVTVTSADGLANTTSQSQTITITPNTGSGTPAPTSLTLTRVSETHKKWREGPKKAHRSKHGPKPPPTGTSFSFTINQPARVMFAFSQTTAGRNVKGRCQAPTRRNRKHPGCKRTRARGTLTYAAATGRRTIQFDGRVAGRKLPDGTYTVRITATNSSQQRSRTASLRFTIAK